MTERDRSRPLTQLEVFRARVLRECERQGNLSPKKRPISRRELAHRMDQAVSAGRSHADAARLGPYEFPDSTSFVAVSEILSGKRTPSFNQMSLIAEVLGVGLVELLVPDAWPEAAAPEPYVQLASGRAVPGVYARTLLCDMDVSNTRRAQRAALWERREERTDRKGQRLAAAVRRVLVPPDELLDPAVIAAMSKNSTLWGVNAPPPVERRMDAYRWVKEHHHEIIRAETKPTSGRCGAAWQRKWCVVVNANSQRVLLEHPDLSDNIPLGPLATFAYSELRLLSAAGGATFNLTESP